MGSPALYWMPDVLRRDLRTFTSRGPAIRARVCPVVRLSVNVNKVATLRNSRGGSFPAVLDAVEVCLSAGAPGITVHPREDERHITPQDVRGVAGRLAEPDARGVELNIEGDPRASWLELVHAVRPAQATLVPVREGEVTSEAGWGRDTDASAMRGWITELKAAGIRVSLFVDAQPDAVRWAADMGADRIELYTEPYARAHAARPAAVDEALAPFVVAAELANSLGLGVNAGHDLDLDNLGAFKAVPHLAEVSIGHALMGRALFVGLPRVVGEYLALLAE